MQSADPERPKPRFVKLLAWAGVSGNIIYLIFISTKLLYKYPQQRHELILSTVITAIFLYIYVKMINAHNVKTYVVSTVLAFLWFGFLLFKYITTKMINDTIESYFLLGSILAVIVNLIALFKIKRCFARATL